MTVHLAARSISRPALGTLRQAPFAARVLAAFEQACDLVTPNGQVIAVVTPQIGDGPLSIVVEARAGVLGTVERNAPVELKGDALQFGHLEIALGDTLVWEPCPNWSALRTRQQEIITNLPALRAIALGYAPADSLLAALDTASYVIPTCGGALVDRPGGCKADRDPDQGARSCEAKNLRSGLEGDVTHLREAAAYLAGRGIGLTPAGDDFLAGVMLWTWLAHPTPEPVCHTLAEVAAPRTTTLSAALLRAAARGECDANWHRLFAALSSDGTAQIALAVQQIVARGATSGADMLAGFLWPAIG